MTDAESLATAAGRVPYRTKKRHLDIPAAATSPCRCLASKSRQGDLECDGRRQSPILDTFHQENAEASPPQTCRDIPATAACAMCCFSVSYPRSLVVGGCLPWTVEKHYTTLLWQWSKVIQIPKALLHVLLPHSCNTHNPAVRFGMGGGRGRRRSDGALRLKIKKNCPVTGIGERDTRRTADECGSTTPHHMAHLGQISGRSSELYSQSRVSWSSMAPTQSPSFRR